MRYTIIGSLRTMHDSQKRFCKWKITANLLCSCFLTKVIFIATNSTFSRLSLNVSTAYYLLCGFIPPPIYLCCTLFEFHLRLEALYIDLVFGPHMVFFHLG